MRLEWAARFPTGVIYNGLPGLLRRRSGTPESVVTVLFEEHRDAMFRYLLLITRNPGVSEELVQDAFLKLHRELQSGTRLDNLRAWLYRVAHNLAIDHGRTYRCTDSLSEEEVTRAAEELASRDAADPEELLLQRERTTQLADAVRRLPASQRNCLHLRREGFRYREIASILGMAETTVIDHIARAIERLRKELHVVRAL